MAHKFRFKLFLAAFFLGFSAIGASAANAIVNVNGDPAGVGSCATGGSCSLRQAINTVVDNDTVFFDIPAASCPNGVCTVSLDNGLTVNKSITILGNGARTLIIKPRAASNPLSFTLLTIGDGTAHPNVAVSGITFSDGYNGAFGGTGGISVKSGATLSFSYASLINCTGSIGGIDSVGGTVTISDSLIANNTGAVVGGILFSNSMTIVNSTVSGNLASNSGAAGGIYCGVPPNQQGFLSLINSTVANNSSMNTGASSGDGIVSVDVPSFLDITNSIIAGNTSGSLNRDVKGNFVSRGNNLVGNTAGSSGFGRSGSNDIINQPARLGPLADNGGSTDTHALLAGSPAINNGNNCVLNSSCAITNPPANLAFDQRAQPFSRRFGATIDIGAFELQQNVVIRKTPFDFDGDGRADIAVTRANNNTFAWYQLNSLYGFSATNFGLISDRLVPADYDGDGKTDIAVTRNNNDNTVTWYILQSRDGFTTQTFGFALDAVVPGDYDGDGKADVAVIRNTSGAFTWYINRSRDGFTAFRFGAQDDIPVVGDYDGDGKSDVAVFRPSNATWYLQQSTAGFSAITFGLGTDKPVPADYDGDGKTNIAVFRASNGTWYTSTNVATDYGAIRFGVNGDKPVPADYDGDGKADVAVTRASGGNLNWYINGSQSGLTGVGFGVASDQPVENAYIP